MIFITLGTQKFQFNRLLKKIDELISEKKIKEKVFAQIGNSDYKPINFKYKEFLNKEEFEECVKKADLIITHAGVGTIITALNFDKRVIVVPRLAKYKEHVDDHQVEIAESFSKKGFVLSSGENIEDLYENIKKSKTMEFKKYISSNKKINNVIDEFITKTEKKNKKIKVLMIGSSMKVKGGIVSVIRNYLEYKNWDDVDIKFIPTHIDANTLVKLIYFFVAIIKIIFSLIRNKYNIVHIHVSERGSVKRKYIVINIIKKISPSTKIVLHHHGAEFDKYYENLKYKEKVKIKKMLRTVDTNIVLSKRLVNSITSKEPKSKVEVLYNAVTTYDNNKYNKDSKELLFLGRLGERKGVYDFLKALSEIKNELIENNIKVNLCGDGEVEKVKEEVRKRNLEKLVSHIGWINAEDKEDFFSRTMINILPSYHEGLPMTILETMAYGIPNISTNIASIPEVIKNGENGYLIEPGDIESLKKYILLLISNKKKRTEISCEAKKTIDENFSIDKHINNLKKIYKSWS